MLPVAMAIASIGSSILGSIYSSADRDKALKLLNDAYSDINELQLPPDMAREVILDKFTQAGLYTPELEQALPELQSKVAQIQENPELINQQYDVLEKLKERSETGLNAEDRLNYNTLRNSVQKDSQAKLGQILQNLQSRGMGGSGNELAMALQSAQGSANQEAEAGDRIAADASNRAYNALISSGDLASKLRSQNFDIEKAKASAADEFARFNTEAQMSRQQRNVAAKNRAQEYNLTTAQDVSNRNTQQANTEKLRQRQGELDNWNNTAKLAELKANAANNMANVKMGQAAQTQQTFQNIGNGISQGIGAYANYDQNQDYLKILKKKYGIKE